MKCSKWDCPEKINLHEHHLVPKFIGGKDRDGRINLCKKHHDELHILIKQFCLEWVEK
jgi:hypothetical protein